MPIPEIPIIHPIIFFAGVVLILMVIYFPFLPDLFRFLIDRGIQAITLILFYALIYGQIGTGLGLPLLFLERGTLDALGRRVRIHSSPDGNRPEWLLSARPRCASAG